MDRAIAARIGAIMAIVAIYGIFLPTVIGFLNFIIDGKFSVNTFGVGMCFGFIMSKTLDILNRSAP